MKKIETIEQLLQYSIDSTKITLEFLDGITLKNSRAIDTQFNPKILLQDIKEVDVDLRPLKLYDSYLIIYLLELEEYCNANNITFRYFGAHAEMQKFIDLLTPKARIKKEAKPNRVFEFIAGLGDKTKRFFNEIFDFVEFLGKTTASSVTGIIKPSTIRWKDFPGYFNNAGVSALAVNILIVLLLGFIIGWQGALLLRQFGAAAYLSPLVGFSIIRELSPLMVAIVVAGRSGAAFTAEIGTMKVSEELDALETMGFNKYGFLVLPRVVALMIAMPILVMICDVVGVLGGLLAGLMTLNITIISYFTTLASMMSIADVLYGLVKAVVFGYMIALIGCFCGMKVTNSAESVGKQTTASVVISIFMVIVIDAIFVVLYDAVF